jgi:hypothetical protein
MTEKTKKQRVVEVGYLDPKKKVGSTIYLRLFQKSVELYLEMESNSGFENDCHEAVWNRGYTKCFGIPDKDALNEVEEFIQKLSSANNAIVEDRRAREALDLTEKISGLSRIVTSLNEIKETLKEEIKLEGY